MTSVHALLVVALAFVAPPATAAVLLTGFEVRGTAMGSASDPYGWNGVPLKRVYEYGPRADGMTPRPTPYEWTHPATGEVTRVGYRLGTVRVELTFTPDGGERRLFWDPGYVRTGLHERDGDRYVVIDQPAYSVTDVISADAAAAILANPSRLYVFDEAVIANAIADFEVEARYYIGGSIYDGDWALRVADGQITPITKPIVTPLPAGFVLFGSALGWLAWQRSRCRERAGTAHG